MTAEELKVSAAEWKHFRFLVFQLEQVTNSPPHFQGYVEFTGTKSNVAVSKLLPRAHWEQRYGTRQQAYDYCSKADTRIGVTHIVGEFASGGQGKRTDLDAIATFAMKTRSVRSCFDKFPGVTLRYSSHIQKMLALMIPSMYLHSFSLLSGRVLTSSSGA